MKNTISNFNYNIAVLSIFTIIFFIGCSSPKDANEKNFTKAIDSYLAKTDIMISPMRNQFPVTIKLSNGTAEWAIQANIALTKKYDALVKAGLLSVKDDEIQQKELIGSGTRSVKAKIYSLTKKGEASFKKPTKTDLLGFSDAGFIVAKQKVQKILSFSEPTPSMGYTTSKVTYTLSLYDISEWATEKSVLDAYPHLSNLFGKNPPDQSDRVILMNDGWVHQNEMK